MKKTLLPLLALFAIIVAACGESNATATQSTPPSQPKYNQPTPTPTPAQARHKLGETVQVFFAWKITISKIEARDTNKLGGLEQVPSKPDYRFIILTLSVENISGFEQKFTSNDFTMKDTAHYQTKPGPILSGDVKAPPDGTIAAHDTNAGMLTFEMPKTEKQFTLQYEMPAANSNTPGDSLFVWDLSV